eukprot:430038-Prymnesium_polylepis.1
MPRGTERCATATCAGGRADGVVLGVAAHLPHEEQAALAAKAAVVGHGLRSGRGSSFGMLFVWSA